MLFFNARHFIRELNKSLYYIKNISLLKTLDYSSVVILLLLIPISYLHKLIPTFEGSTFFRDINGLDSTYSLIKKFVSFLFLSLWFVSCAYQWGVFILLPLLMFFFRFAYCLLEKLNLVGEELIYELSLIPIVALVGLLLCQIRNWRLKLERSDGKKRKYSRQVHAISHCTEGKNKINWKWKLFKPKKQTSCTRFSKAPWVVFLICASVPLHYACLLFPKDKTFLIFSVEYFADMREFMCYVTGSFISSMLLVVWFFTSERWWRFFILWPLMLYLFQILNWVGLEIGLRSSDGWYFGLIVLFILYPLCRYKDSFCSNKIYERKVPAYNLALKPYALSRVASCSYQLFWLVLILSFFIHDFFSPSEAVKCFLSILYDSRMNIFYPEVFFCGKLLLSLFFFFLFCRSNKMEKLLFSIPFVFYSTHLVGLIVENENIKTFHQNEIWYFLPIVLVLIAFFYKNKENICWDLPSDGFKKDFYPKKKQKHEMCLSADKKSFLS